MIRIKITPWILSLANEYAKDAFADMHSKPKDRLDKLKDKLKTMTKKESVDCEPFEDYLENLKDHWDEIIILKPDEFEYYHTTYFDLTEKQLKEKFNDKEFYKHVVEAMRYDDVKLKMRPYIAKMGIRTCVYCNAQYAATYSLLNEKGQMEVRGHYEFDHNYAKSKYPFLCVSFFNLIPSCGNCNKNRSEKFVAFNPYTTNDDIKPFRFELTESSIVKYCLTHQAESLEIRLSPNNMQKETYAMLKNHQERFHIDALYENFKEEAADIVQKTIFMDNNYLIMMQASFQNRLIQNDIDRLILGFDTDLKMVHNTPLNMLKQDIAGEMGFSIKG